MSAGAQRWAPLQPLAPAPTAKRSAEIGDSTPRNKRPRQNNLTKCARCRKDKVGCAPQSRTKGQRCDRCINKGLPCSVGTRVMRGGGTSPPALTLSTSNALSASDHDLDAEMFFQDWQILLGYYQDLKLGLNQLEVLQRDIEIIFVPRSYRRIPKPEAQDFRRKVKQVNTVLMRITSMLPPIHLPNAISAIFDQDEICLLDEVAKVPKTDTALWNHPTYARMQSCRRRLRELSMAYDEDYDDDVWDEIEAEKTVFAAHISRLCDKTNEVLKKSPELTGHEFEGFISITPLLPYDEAVFCHVVDYELNDCLKRTQLHRMLDQVMDQDFGILRERAYDHLRDMIGVNHTDVLGRSVLHLACQKGWEYGVEKLLADGANPSIKTAYGSLPLHYAAANGFASICAMLLQHMGSERLDEKDDFRTTAFDYARQKGHDSVEKLLRNWRQTLPSSSERLI